MGSRSTTLKRKTEFIITNTSWEIRIVFQEFNEDVFDVLYLSLVTTVKLGNINLAHGWKIDEETGSDHMTCHAASLCSSNPSTSDSETQDAFNTSQLKTLSLTQEVCK